MVYDLVILGGSAAGASAAIYAARRKLNFVLLSGDIGGEIAVSGIIENYPGYTSVTGAELSAKLREQLEYNQVPMELGMLAENLKKEDEIFKITAKNLSGEIKSYEARSVLVTTGVKPRRLKVPGEDEFERKGVTWCAICDGPLFKNKMVAVIGGGNSALDAALMMGEIASQVYLINKNPAFKGERVLIDKALVHPKIKIIYEAKTTKILGDKMVTGLEYEENKTKKIQKLDVQGVFINIGYFSNSGFVAEVNKNAGGQIITNQAGETNIPGLYAAGDVTDVPYKQIAIASGMGVLAVLSAVDYINKFPQQK